MDRSGELRSIQNKFEEMCVGSNVAKIIAITTGKKMRKNKKMKK